MIEDDCGENMDQPWCVLNAVKDDDDDNFVLLSINDVQSLQSLQNRGIHRQTLRQILRRHHRPSALEWELELRRKKELLKIKN